MRGTAVRSDPIFVRVAADPSLISGIYNTCDQWCMYCPATGRCLAYRCSPDIQSGKQDIHKNLADRLYEGMTFLKQLCNAEGRPTPEIDEMLSNDLRQTTHLPKVDDPIQRMGLRYARMSRAYLHSRRDYPFEMRPHVSGPTPFEVFAWFHMLISVKIYRALASAAAVARGDESQRNDVFASAKVALIGIHRSLDAIAAMAADDEDPRLELLQAQLRRLRREMQGRFPTALDFMRAGLDRPAEGSPGSLG